MLDRMAETLVDQQRRNAFVRSVRATLSAYRACAAGEDRAFVDRHLDAAAQSADHWFTLIGRPGRREHVAEVDR